MSILPVSWLWNNCLALLSSDSLYFVGNLQMFYKDHVLIYNKNKRIKRKIYSVFSCELPLK